jgi:hypothetical protein
MLRGHRCSKEQGRERQREHGTHAKN